MVRNTLAVYGGLTVDTRDLGTLCQSAGNKWSKYKPVRLNSSLNFTDWWKGNDGNCGFEIPEYGTIDELFVAMRSNTPVWNYLKPRGLAYNEPYRLLDFVGYSVEARPPLVRVKLEPLLFSDDQYIYNIINGTTATAYELTLNDMGQNVVFSSMYFGVGISRKNTTIYNYITTSNPIGNQMGASINLPMPAVIDDYDLVFFLCENPKLSLSDVFPGNIFYPVMDPIQRVSIQNALTVNLTGIINVMNEQVDYTLAISNLSNVNRSLANGTIIFRYGDNEPTDNPEVGEDSVNLGTISLTPNETKVINGSMYGVGENYPTRGGYVYFSNTTNSKYNFKRIL